MEIYEIIKNRRKELGLSADDVAEALGVSRATIYRYESTEIEKIPITAIVPLAQVLHCSPGYLMGWDDIKESIPSCADIQKEELLRNYELLNDEGRKNLLNQSRLLVKSGDFARIKGGEDFA